MELYDIEQILLGKLIISPELLDKYGALIHKDLFTFPVNISTYVAICKLKENNKDIDIVSLSKIVKGENISYNLAHMLDVGYSPVKITNCIATLTENYHKNTLAALVNDINNKFILLDTSKLNSFDFLAFAFNVLIVVADKGFLLTAIIP